MWFIKNTICIKKGSKKQLIRYYIKLEKTNFFSTFLYSLFKILKRNEVHS